MRRVDLVKEIDPDKLKVNNIKMIIIHFLKIKIFHLLRLWNGLKEKKETLELYLVHYTQYYGKDLGGIAISVIW